MRTAHQAGEGGSKTRHHIVYGIYLLAFVGINGPIEMQKPEGYSSGEDCSALQDVSSPEGQNNPLVTHLPSRGNQVDVACLSVVRGRTKGPVEALSAHIPAPVNLMIGTRATRTPP
jgi:hypothetical protein